MEPGNLAALTALLISYGFDKAVPQLEKQKDAKSDVLFLNIVDRIPISNYHRHPDELEIVIELERKFPLSNFNLERISAYLKRQITLDKKLRLIEVEKHFVAGKDKLLGKKDIYEYCTGLISPMETLKRTRPKTERVLKNQPTDTEKVIIDRLQTGIKK